MSCLSRLLAVVGAGPAKQYIRITPPYPGIRGGDHTSFQLGLHSVEAEAYGEDSVHLQFTVDTETAERLMTAYGAIIMQGP